MLHNREDSEDAVQDALLLAYRKLHQFQGRSSFSTWLHSIVRNTARLYYRNAKAQPMLSTDHELFEEEQLAAENVFVDAHPTPEESWAQRERSLLLRSAANTLPKRCQAAVLQFYCKGLGEAVAAKTLGITVPALKARLHRSRHLLTRRIRQKCAPRASMVFLNRRSVARRCPAVGTGTLVRSASMVGIGKYPRPH
jgi:RNA polymerase sigma-70 factor (ECF subfamily)